MSPALRDAREDRISALITPDEGNTYMPRCTVQSGGFTLVNVPMRSVFDLMPSISGNALRVILSIEGFASVTVSKGAFLLALGETL